MLSEKLSGFTSKKFWQIAALCALLVPASFSKANDLFAPYFQPLYFTNIDPETSAINPVINVIEQDSAGYIWLGTQDGLDRYDGKNLTHFNVSRNAQSSLSSNWINDILQDSEGRLWIATRGGVDLYLPETERFKPQTYRKDFPANTEFRQIIELPNGHIWFISLKDGIYSLNPREDIVTHITFDSIARDDPKLRLGDVVVHSNSIFISLLEHGLYQYNLQTNAFTPVTNVNRQFEKIKLTKLHISKNSLWGINRAKTLFSIDLSNTYTVVEHPLIAESCGGFLSDILVDVHKTVWVASDQGLCGYDVASQTTYLYKNDGSKRHGLIGNNVISLFQDASDVVWVGTMSGVSRWNANQRIFNHISNNDGFEKLINSDIVTSFVFDPILNNHYIGSFGGGVSIVNQLTNKVSFINTTAFSNMSDERVMALEVDEDQQLWIGTYNSGVHKYDPYTNELTLVRKNENNVNTLSANAISKIRHLSNGDMAIATFGGGLNILSKSGQFTHYNSDQSDETKVNFRNLLDIVEDNEGRLWIATINEGLNVLELNTKTIRSFSPESEIGKRIPGKNIFALHNTSDYLWMGTEAAGAIRLKKDSVDSDTLEFKVFDPQNGLDGNSIYGILSDDKDNVWVSHSKGFSVIYPNDEITNFTTAHGLQGKDFTSGAFYDDGQGKFFFGGANGFNVFEPNDIKVSAYHAPLTLSAYAKANKPISLFNMLNNRGEIELEYSDSFISFEFAVLDFTDPINNAIEYSLEGLYSDVIKNGNDLRVSFSSIPDGKYTLRVKGYNSDNEATENEIVIPITVHPPLWRSTIAYIVYVTLLILVFYFLLSQFRRKSRHQREFQKQLQKQVHERTIELNESNTELEKAVVTTKLAKEEAEGAALAKSIFLATMSHEIRTPMNSILGMGELLLNTNLDNVQRKYAATAHRSTEMLLEIINNILDFSKIEVNKVALEEISFDLHTTVEEAIFHLAGRAQEKGLSIELTIATDCPTQFYGDPIRIRQIVTNIVGNAIKFTESGHVKTHVSNESGSVLIVVKDTGIGIANNKLATIFDPFEQAESSTTRRFGGSGLGLNITKTLVELMEGSIQVSSEKNVGTMFTVSLPLKVVAVSRPDIEKYKSLEVLLFLPNKSLRSCCINTLQRAHIKYGVREKLDIEDTFDSTSLLLLEVSTYKNIKDLAFFENNKHRIIVCSATNSGLSHEELNNLTVLSSPITKQNLLSAIDDLTNVELEHAEDTNPLHFGKTNYFDAKVLLVEDVRTNQEVAKGILSQLGCEIELAENGMIAVQMAHQVEYDLIFMDYQMPVMDGIAATQLIKKQLHHKKVPFVIALTADYSDTNKDKWLAVQVDGFMNKPFNSREMLATLKQFLSPLIVQKSPSNIEVLSSAQPAESIGAWQYQYLDESVISSIRAIEQSAGNDMLSKLVNIFVEESEEKLPKMKLTIENNNTAELASIAHAFKSMAGNVGATTIQMLSAEIETLALNNDSRANNERLQMFEVTLLNTIAEFTSITQATK